MTYSVLTDLLRADIEGSKSNVAMNAWLSGAGLVVSWSLCVLVRIQGHVFAPSASLQLPRYELAVCVAFHQNPIRLRC